MGFKNYEYLGTIHAISPWCLLLSHRLLRDYHQYHRRCFLSNPTLQYAHVTHQQPFSVLYIDHFVDFLCSDEKSRHLMGCYSICRNEMKFILSLSMKPLKKPWNWRASCIFSIYLSKGFGNTSTSFNRNFTHSTRPSAAARCNGVLPS